MDVISPTAALSVDQVHPSDFRGLASATEYGRCDGYSRLGIVPGFSFRNGELLYRLPQDILLLFISGESLSPATFVDARNACLWIESHANQIRAAIRAAEPSHQIGDTPRLSIRLVVPGFRDDWRAGIRLLSYPTEVVELGLASDSLGHRFLLQRSVPSRAHSLLPRALAIDGTRDKASHRSKAGGDSLGLDALMGHLILAIGPSWKDEKPSVLSFDFALGTYAVLVAMAARLLYGSTPTRTRRHANRESVTENKYRRMLRDVMPLLGAVAKYFVHSSPDIFSLRLPRTPWPNSVDKAIVRLTEKYPPSRRKKASVNWEVGVPRTFSAFVEEMAPPAVSLLQVTAFDSHVQESASVILGNASLGLTAAANAACSCDMLWGIRQHFSEYFFDNSLTPSGGIDPTSGVKALRATLVRTVCAHRVVLEMAGLPDRSIATALLSDTLKAAEDLASRIANDDSGVVSHASIWLSGQTSLASLKERGSLRKEEKHVSDILRLCVSQERAISRFFAFVP